MLDAAGLGRALVAWAFMVVGLTVLVVAVAAGVVYLLIRGVMSLF